GGALINVLCALVAHQGAHGAHADVALQGADAGHRDTRPTVGVHDARSEGPAAVHGPEDLTFAGSLCEAAQAGESLGADDVVVAPLGVGGRGAHGGIGKHLGHAGVAVHHVGAVQVPDDVAAPGRCEGEGEADEVVAAVTGG